MRTWRARVVEVVLARDAMPAALEHAAEQVPDEGAARVADGQRAGRVGRDELDVDVPRVLRLGRGRSASPAVPRLVEHPLQERWREPQVDEAGRGDRDVLEHRARPRRRPLQASARASAIRSGGIRSRPRELHREVRREVAMRRGRPAARPRCASVGRRRSRAGAPSTWARSPGGAAGAVGLANGSRGRPRPRRASGADRDRRRDRPPPA